MHEQGIMQTAVKQKAYVPSGNTDSRGRLSLQKSALKFQCAFKLISSIIPQDLSYLFYPEYNQLMFYRGLQEILNNRMEYLYTLFHIANTAVE